MKTSTSQDMKTTINKIRFMMLLGFLAIGLTSWGQRPNVEKMSVTTQIFLDELENPAKFKAPSLQPGLTDFLENHPSEEPFVASPDTINGKVYISSYIRVASDTVINQLRAAGVEIECEFGSDLMTALIPVDKITEIAAIEGVKRIEVASVLRPMTDKAREASNVDDVLAWSSDAVAAGLDHEYDGSGVILGIIDTGIDFKHIAFKDKDGNSRIKGLLCYTNTTDDTANPAYDWTGSGTIPNYDITTSDHGTHTSSIAGGSSVIISGSNVTVTDDHTNATYGGMAPGADLYLAGVGTLYDTRTSNALKKMAEYADAQNKPLVVNNSWGSQWGPHDGTGTTADVVSRYYGDNHPEHICLFAAGNDAGKASDSGEGGGYHLSGIATSANPLQTIVRKYYSNANGGCQYDGIIASAWARSTGVTKMAVKIHVIDTSTGQVKNSWTVTNETSTFNGLSTYYSGTLRVYYDYVTSDKTQILIYTSTLQATDMSSSNGYYTSKYSLAFEFYPYSGAASSVIDVWSGGSTYFTDFVPVNGYNWTAGSDDMSVSDETTIPTAISIGAYVTKNRIVDYNGTSHDYSGSFPMDDIAYFSSYATADQSPTGLQYPWITAPGARIVSAVNHNHTSDDDNYINGEDGKIDRVNANTTYPYGAMQGTSMACPAAAGIVALWLQAAREEGKTMTTSDIKEVMAETAIQDSWTTTGPNASHFGNGKINALGGIEYILGGANPKIIAIPTDVTFNGEPGGTYTVTVYVKGHKLTEDIMASLDDANGVFSIDPVNLGQHISDLTITFNPTSEGEYTATVTLTSEGAEPVIITIRGTALIHTTSVNSNAVVVPVYHSDVDTHYPYIFSLDDVENDMDMSLSYPYNNGSDVSVQVQNDGLIQCYELHHKIGENGNWTYPDGDAVATANHVDNSYVVNDATFTFPADATQMWVDMKDSQLPQNLTEETYYVPVTFAKSIVEGSTQVNSYGAPIRTKDNDKVYLEVRVEGYKSDKNVGGHWTQTLANGQKVEYCVYAPVVSINSSDLTGETHKPYMFRAWLVGNDSVTYYDYKRENGAIVGDTVLHMPKLLGTLVLDETVPGGTVFIIGRDWSVANDWGTKLENSFGAPSNGANVNIVVRAYYQKVSGAASLRGNRDGEGSYAYSEGSGDGDGIMTAVMELTGVRQVVDVKYVNVQGMQSDKPFDGLNIVVTRYSDGTTTATKVVR